MFEYRGGEGRPDAVCAASAGSQSLRIEDRQRAFQAIEKGQKSHAQPVRSKKRAPSPVRRRLSRVSCQALDAAFQMDAKILQSDGTIHARIHEFARPHSIRRTLGLESGTHGNALQTRLRSSGGRTSTRPRSAAPHCRFPTCVSPCVCGRARLPPMLFSKGGYALQRRRPTEHA